MSEFPFRCYETFSGGNIAFERDGHFHFGPAAKLSAFLSGSSESFLIDAEAEAKVAELQALQAKSGHFCRAGALITASETDNLAIIRKRWEQERSSNKWGNA
jgi:hypothetical protein